MPSIGFRSPVLGSQPVGDVSHKPGDRLPLLSARSAITLQPLRGLLPISLIGEQTHDGVNSLPKTVSRHMEDTHIVVQQTIVPETGEQKR